MSVRRRDLIRYLEEHDFYLLREGGNHSIYTNGVKTIPVKRQRVLKETASMPDEDEWMEWKGVAVMLEAWQQALRDILDSAHLKL